MKYLKNILKKVPQNLPLDETQVPNSAGGYVWAVDSWTRLTRFLILGSEGGTYYTQEATLTHENLKAVKECIEADGLRTVKTIVEISHGGRAPKNDPALYALAMCAAFGDEVTRKAALAALPQVARIGTHLLHFAEFVNSMRGWGRGLRNAIGDWYETKTPTEVANQVTKYAQRDGWTHRDLLRLSHTKAADPVRNAVYSWVVKGAETLPAEKPTEEALQRLWVVERLKQNPTEKEILQLMEEYRLPMEVVPSEHRSKAVYEAILPHAGLTYLFRNLGNLSKGGVLVEGAWDTIRLVTERLTNAEALKRGRIHPIQVLSAYCTYAQGHGMRGKGQWTPVPAVLSALDEAFEKAFGNVEPTGLRHLLGLDVSGSMGWGEIAGVPGMTPRAASCAMALLALRTEQNSLLMGFGHEFVPLPIAKTDSVTVAMKKVDNLPFMATDCALPMLYALKHRIAVDMFVVYTDSETWFGETHPYTALEQYRQSMGIAARLAVVGMTSNGFTIANPQDRGMLDVVGFDTATPNILREFGLGQI